MHQLYFRFALVIALIALGRAATTGTIMCRKCENATTRSDCTRLVTCDSAIEECYMDQVITDQLTVVFNGGCRAKQVCNGMGGLGKKRDGDLIACSRCCDSGDDCNMPLCGIKAAPTTQLPIVSAIRCRVCNRATDLSECKKVAICDRALEECYMDEKITDQLTIVYEGGCRPKDVCTGRFGKKREELIACSRCCDSGDDCNRRLCGIKDALLNTSVSNVPVTNKQVADGRELTLNCSDRYNNPQNVSWSKTDTCGRNSVLSETGSVLYQRNATLGDSGQYMCSYIDRFGTTIEQYFRVNITSTTQGLCNFDDGSLCGWQQQKNDSFDWVLQSGPTLTSGTGPNNDHTLATVNGKYLYIEASAPRIQGDFAVLASPVQPANQTRCFQFWYYMYGDGIGELNVHLQDTCLRNETEIFRQVGQNGEHWNKASVTIHAQSVPHDYIILIKGDVGSTFLGDTSLDDLGIQNGKCLGNHGPAIVG